MALVSPLYMARVTTVRILKTPFPFSDSHGAGTDNMQLEHSHPGHLVHGRIREVLAAIPVGHAIHAKQTCEAGSTHADIPEYELTSLLA